MLKCQFHTEMSLMSLSGGPASRQRSFQFPPISSRPPFGMSRLILPVVLAALLITSIHLWGADRHPSARRIDHLHCGSTREMHQLTVQRCTRSPLGKSRRETWTEAWRRTPCECCRPHRACSQCSRAAGGSPAGSRPGNDTVMRFHVGLNPMRQTQTWGRVSWPGGFYRRTSRSWWTRPRVSASRYCSWTFSGGTQTAGSAEEKGAGQTLITAQTDLCWNLMWFVDNASLGVNWDHWRWSANACWDSECTLWSTFSSFKEQIFVWLMHVQHKYTVSLTRQLR